MCIIIYSPDGRICEKHLRRSLANNPHGWGLMWPVRGGDRIEIVKGLTRSDFWGAWESRPSGMPVVFHSRIATHGDIDVSNCHPFQTKSGLGVAHNGVIHPCAGSRKLSDTRIFVRDILNNLPENWEENPAILRLLEDFVGTSKLAIMDAMGRVTIVNEDRGHWGRRGNWYSNESYRAYRVQPTQAKRKVEEPEVRRYQLAPGLFGYSVK